MGAAPQRDFTGERERAAEEVLLRLLAGPATTETMADDLAARCGSRRAVQVARHRLGAQGLMEPIDPGAATERLVALGFDPMEAFQ